MSELGAVFAFGPNNGYFFEYNGVRKWRNLPGPLERILKGKRHTDKGVTEGIALVGIEKTFCLALGEGGGYIIVYKDKSGSVCYDYANIPENLQKWVEGTSPTAVGKYIKRDSIRVSLGRKRQFFATGLTSDYMRCYRWRIENNENFEEWAQFFVGNTAPGAYSGDAFLATFGTDYQYVIYQADSQGQSARGQWLVYAGSALTPILCREFGVDVETPMETRKAYNGQYIILNPFQPDQYFLLRPDSSAEWQVSILYSDEVKEVCEMIQRDQTVSGSTSPRGPEQTVYGSTSPRQPEQTPARPRSNEAGNTRRRSSDYPQARGYETEPRSAQYETAARR